MHFLVESILAKLKNLNRFFLSSGLYYFFQQWRIDIGRRRIRIKTRFSLKLNSVLLSSWTHEYRKKKRSYIIYQACPKRKCFEIISRNVSSSLIRSELGSLTVVPTTCQLVCNRQQLLYSHFKTCIARLKHCLNMNKYLRNVYCVRKRSTRLFFSVFIFREM